MYKPKCKECQSNKDVVKVDYRDGLNGPIYWHGFECEKCYRVVETIWEAKIKSSILRP